MRFPFLVTAFATVALCSVPLITCHAQQTYSYLIQFKPTATRDEVEALKEYVKTDTLWAASNFQEFPRSNLLSFESPQVISQNDLDDMLTSQKDTIDARGSVNPSFVGHGMQGDWPNDTHFERQHGLRRIRAIQGWKYRKKTTRTIWLLDTGCHLKHSDLQGCVRPGKNYTNEGNRGCVNCYTKDLGYAESHGTSVAGLIGAGSNNDDGICSICFEGLVNHHKVLRDVDRVGLLSSVAEAIRDAAAAKADIIVCPWGGSSDPYGILFRALEKAAAEGCLVVTSAGNDSCSLAEKPVYPASYGDKLSNLIVVASSDYATVKLDPLSNWHPEAVHLVAPGRDVFSTGVKLGHGRRLVDQEFGCTGTSFAAAIVAAACALAMDEHNLEAHQVRDFLMKRVTRSFALKNKVKSGGELNLEKLLEPAKY